MFFCKTKHSYTVHARFCIHYSRRTRTERSFSILVSTRCNYEWDSTDMTTSSV